MAMFALTVSWSGMMVAVELLVVVNLLSRS